MAEYTISHEQCDHIKKAGFNPRICPECQEIDAILMRQVANANLIAAAPELYEALQNALWHLDPTHNSGKATFRTDELLSKIKEAIAKAESK